ncbi:NRDE protein-domain-containing protein [Limtongia smithiae]|uniref:NRDE protein-domain-containing protein n=1 Tax=Limtongia smithiae TaxID=1125753 RepID=UPI0034CFC9D2
MCILLLCTAHPKYPLIVLSNRDEYLNRPTAPASFWPCPDSDVFAPRDLAREEHGTWIGISKTGRLAILVNFRESTRDDNISPISRGALVKGFLTARDIPTATWIEDAIFNAGPNGLFAVGGFSMICGTLRPLHRSAASPADTATGAVEEPRLESFGVLTNRSTSLNDGTAWLFGDAETHNPTLDGEGHATHNDALNELTSTVRAHTYGLSNSLYTHPWPKVHKGCTLLSGVVARDIMAVRERATAAPKTTDTTLDGDDVHALVDDLFAVLSVDELPRAAEPAQMFDALRHSIFIPVFSAVESTFGGSTSTTSPTTTTTVDAATSIAVPYTFVKGNYYGTRTQTVILVDNNGHVTYAEHTLHERDDGGHAEEIVKPSWTEFDIEGWNS